MGEVKPEPNERDLKPTGLFLGPAEIHFSKALLQSPPSQQTKHAAERFFGARLGSPASDGANPDIQGGSASSGESKSPEQQ